MAGTATPNKFWPTLYEIGLTPRRLVATEFETVLAYGVGLTDLELRLNVTEGLQLAVGANNIFNIKPNGDYYVPSALLGQGALADGGIIVGAPVNESFNPNGGLYYARISFNF